MSQVHHEVLVFDRFSLDLTRGCLRSGPEDLVLSPKAFDMLRHLAENAGRLVSKQELHDAVWGNISVSDDSIVQCIRELRLKLGDDRHSLIKTVPRRGYLLDALAERPQQTPSPTMVIGPARNRDSGRSGFTQRAIKHQPWIAAALLVLVFATVAAAAPVAKWAGERLRSLATLLKAESSLFSEMDAKRLAAIGLEKQLPVPSFQIFEPSSIVPEHYRRFVGVWISETGWVNSNRQFMMVVTNVGNDGIADGYLVNGPSAPQSHIKSPAFSGRFTGSISADSLRYDGNAGMHLASLKSDGRIEFKLMFNDGHLAVVSLAPFWTLPPRSLATAGVSTN